MTLAITITVAIFLAFVGGCIITYFVCRARSDSEEDEFEGM